MKKRRILLASVLKPVDEPRMYERMGQSLAVQGDEVFIIGFPPSAGRNSEGIHFLPHQRFNRISWARVFVRFIILKRIFSLMPDILIVSSHELLGVSIIYRVLTGRKTVYDIRENYYLNIRYTTVFPKAFRLLIASLVRLKEVASSVFISRFILAEKCFVQEMRFVYNKYDVIENKCRLPNSFKRSPNPGSIQLIFTGTIAESTGVFQAIALAKKLHARESKIKLNIIGYCAQSSVLRKIESEISSSPFITLTGGAEVVSHQVIMDAIASAGFGIIYYPTSPHTENKTPTKLYEYLACQLPILLQDHKPWVEMCQTYPAAIALDFERFDPTSIIKQMQELRFYSVQSTDATWQHEEAKLIACLNSI